MPPTPPNDVRLPGLDIPVGPGVREQMPQLAFQNWLGGQYIPPTIKALLTSLYGQMYQEYLTKQSSILDPMPTQFSRQTSSGQTNLYNPGRTPDAATQAFYGARWLNPTAGVGSSFKPGSTTDPNVAKRLAQEEGYSRGGGGFGDIPTFGNYLSGFNPMAVLRRLSALLPANLRNQFQGIQPAVTRSRPF